MADSPSTIILSLWSDRMRGEYSLDTLKGIGEKTRLIFEKAGILTLDQLLAYYPRAYDSFEEPKKISELREGETAAVCGCLTAPLSGRYVRGLSILSGLLQDESGKIPVTWFNMVYLKNTILPGKKRIFRGRIKSRGGRLILEQPALYEEEAYGELTRRLSPVYALSGNLTNKMVSKAVRQALDRRELVREYLPDRIRKEYHLAEYNFALEQIHFPEDSRKLLLARNRLVFDEFFFFLLQLRQLKSRREKEKSVFRIGPASCVKKVLDALPYELTGAQKKVWNTIERELQGGSVMARLIQGDVGSGKTILALLALLSAAEAGMQGALMVPTEVLARQHFQSLKQLIEDNGLPYQAVLLTGSMKAKERREAYEKIASGEVSVVVGTHALIQEKVSYKNLAVVITDEQHRFGVRQREALSQKGRMPHTIVMSATPIPRTLAVILYGDLDISVIDEMPANRIPIRTCVVNTGYRKKAYQFLEKEIRMGHQAYVICPMVEESEAMEGENVLDYSRRLREEFPDWIQIDYLHGKMKPAEKNERMERFLRNEIQVLVSTTVIEVGVNVPNATVILIENAERFGLAQLHQLRGRVGRGKDASYCILIYGTEGKQIQERLAVLRESNDGFEIANRDLKLRGPGDLFGVRQSGMMEFVLADIYADAGLLQQANQAVGELLEEDPELEKEEHRELKRKFEGIVRKQSESVNL